MNKKIFIIGEIGINHNGDLEIAKKLIKGAKEAGADAVKFQKRSVNKVYTKEYLDSSRESPYGKTQRDQKEGLEFSEKQYLEINNYCNNLGIDWFASAWDLESQNFLNNFKLKYNKVASAMLTHYKLLELIASEKRHTFISTGMHSIEEIKIVVEIFKKNNCPFELMHCVSTYPTNIEDSNLKMIETLRNEFKCNIGFSSHESGRAVSTAACAFGISSLERHITLDRAMYGSDQSASMEITGFKMLIDYVRAVEKALGDGKKKISEEEKKIREKLKPIEV